MVTGPVSIPFMGLSVSDWAKRAQATVMGAGRLTSPKITGGLTQREP